MRMKLHEGVEASGCAWATCCSTVPIHKVEIMKHDKSPEPIMLTLDSKSSLASPIMQDFERITDTSEWKSEAQRLLNQSEFSPEFVQEFHTAWTVAGRRIREQIGNDRLLVRLLRHVGNGYSGNEVELFRGENLDRYEDGRIGLCWTKQIRTAQMFGSGLNSVGKGGILLKAQCPSQCVIYSPNEHSQRLGENEFTIDPFSISSIVALERFPPCN